MGDRVVLAVHGGAGTTSTGRLGDDVEEASRHALRAALAAGHALLQRGGGALDAVEAAVASLENAAVFNAGRGAVYSADATQELEAAIMSGHDRAAGAAAGLRHVRNPVRLARAVLDHSPHVLLAGDGAERFAAAHGVDLVDAVWFHSEHRLRSLLADAGDPGAGTVGAVACDTTGRMAAATSTGGLTGKAPGRIGDTPLVGAGTYADEQVAVSTTGAGEAFVRAVAAHSVATLLRHAGLGLQDATARVLTDVAVLGGHGGLVALDAHGRCALPFDTGVMHRGQVTAGGATCVALYGDEALG